MSDHAARLKAEPWRKLYWTARWKRLRARQLQLEPLCAMCLKRKVIRPGNTVDHKTPHRGDDALMWGPNNLQTLCASCHSSDKQAIERGGKPRVQIGLDGWPCE